MNEFEMCMLFICFGGALGTIIGYFILSILHIVEFIQRKRERRKEVS